MFASVIYLFGCVLNYYGLSPTRLFYEEKISKKEQSKILRMLSFYQQQFIRFDGKNKINLTLERYIVALIFYFLIRNIAEMKRLFFENNNETMFPKLSALTQKIDALEEENATVKEELSRAKEAETTLRNEIASFASKDAGRIVKPYMEEISFLRKEIEALNQKLDIEKKKDAELNALREFAFEVKSEYKSADATSNLLEHIRHKTIVVIGGHINWRNKLKAKYPTITVFDGHLETADFSVLNRANFVFLNTSNMSHDVYYKAISVLRNSQTPFDYLGRTLNQELYENEMLDSDYCNRKSLRNARISARFVIQ